MAYKKVRGNGKPISLPSRNNFGQLDYRVQVSKEFYDAANALYAAAKADGACKNKTAPAWHDEERDIYTVTVRASQTGMYPLGVVRNQICRVTVQIGTDGYHKTIASATEEVAEKNAIVAEQKLDAVREALDDRRFTEQTTGIDAKLRAMVELASDSGIHLGDLMSADKIISAEKERVAEAKKATARKGSGLRNITSSGVKTKVEDKPEIETETPAVKLTVKTITKWEALSEDELQEAMKQYAETVDVTIEDVQAAYDIAVADTSDVPF